MSALAEALVAAQRRALTATEKAYVAGHITLTDAVAELNAFGLTDQVDIDFLLAALDVIRMRGAQLPAEATPPGEPTPKPPEPATDAQLALVARLVKEKNVLGPDLPLTKAQAHEVIDSCSAVSCSPSR